MGAILHFIPDEKITDQMIENFNAIGRENVFLIFKKPGEPFKYTKNVSENVIEYNSESANINDIIALHHAKGIMVHGMQLVFAKTILEIKNKVKIAWVVWGFDIYVLPKIKPDLYADKTGSFLLKSDKKLFIERIIKKNDFLRKIYFKYLLRSEDYYGTIFKAIGKVDYFCSYIEEDYQLFSFYYPSNLQFFNGAFSSIQQYLGGIDHLEISDKATNILLGNSNTPECNHIDAIFNLSSYKTQLKNVKIYTPLNYGGKEEYKHEVIKCGVEKFGDSFTPMIDFMERANYMLVLQSCSTGIFYHYRQQALGNIIAMLWLGARIYLSSKNPAYKYLKRIGIKVFDFDKDFKIFLNSRLDKVEVQKNREILNSIFSSVKVKQDLLRLSDILTN